MNHRLSGPVLLLAAALALTLAGASPAGAQAPPGDSTASTPLPLTDTTLLYQGRLVATYGPVSGTCGFTFTLYDAVTDGRPVGEPVVAPAVAVVTGLFSVPLDFGAAAVSDGARYLDITVQCPGDASPIALTPRQPLTAVPRAVSSASTQRLQGRAVSADAPATGQALVWDGGSWAPESVGAYRAGAGLTLSHTTFALDTGYTDDRYWRQGGSAFNATGVLGTTDARALELVVDGQRALRLEPSATSPNVVGGFSGNSAAAYVYGATIGGGGVKAGPADVFTPGPNRVADAYGTVSGGASNQAGNAGDGVNDRPGATVGGGLDNTAEGQWSAVGGGLGNTAGGAGSVIGGGQGNQAGGGRAAVAGGSGNSAQGSETFVGGGEDNEAKGEAATVAGGRDNSAAGAGSAVSGGSGNSAAGDGSTVGGGAQNTAGGAYSFVAGRRATVAGEHPGAFLFADSTNAAFASAAANEFAARATGGVRFVTAVSPAGAPTAGAQLAPGGGSWSSLSDRSAKTGLAPVDGRAVLARVATLPISTWSYTTQDPAIRHIGPMAQDFATAFGVGEDERHITAVDADGVALAAIQGLNAELEERDARIAALEARLAALERDAARPAASELGAAALGALAAGALALGGLAFRQQGGAR